MSCYQDLDNQSVRMSSERAKTVQTKCTFCGGTNHSAKKCFKKIKQEMKNIVRLVLRTTDKRSGYLENDLYVDLKII